MTSPTRGHVVISDDEPIERGRPSPLPALAAAVLLIVGLYALQARPLATTRIDSPPVTSAPLTEEAAPSGFRATSSTKWSEPRHPNEWVLSRVYRSSDGRGMALTAQTTFRHDVLAPNALVADRPALLRSAQGLGLSMLQWNDLGFAYTLLGERLARDELIAVGEAIVYDVVGLGSVVAPRPSAVPDGLQLVDQRAGPAHGTGTGGAGWAATFAPTDGSVATMSVVASQGAVVRADHIGLMLGEIGRRELDMVLPAAEGPDGVMRLLLRDDGETTYMVSTVGLSPWDRERALIELGLPPAAP